MKFYDYILYVKEIMYELEILKVKQNLFLNKF